MAVELWRWQYGRESEMWAAAVLSDGYPVVAGSVRLGLDDDFLAIKLDPLNGSVIWTWEEGTTGGDRILGAAAAEDGAVILAGYTEGYWTVKNNGGSDFAAVKLDSSGDIMWCWQEGTAVKESLTSVAVAEDGSVVMGGYSSDNFVMVKLDAHGKKMWNWTGGSGESEYGNAVGILRSDGSAVLVGSTSGDWDGGNPGSADYAAVNIDADEEEVWRWQNGTAGVDILYAESSRDDGAMYVGGIVDGVTDAGSFDAIAAKLDANHAFSWKWQEGSALKDMVRTTAMARNGFAVVSGYSEGCLVGTNKGDDDFFAAMIDPNSSRRFWLWQDGTEKRDRVQAIAATPDGAMILTGSTAGSFAGNNTFSSLQGVAVMLQTSAILAISSTPSLASDSTNNTYSNTSTPAPSPLWTFAPSSPPPTTITSSTPSLASDSTNITYSNTSTLEPTPPWASAPSPPPTTVAPSLPPTAVVPSPPPKTFAPSPAPTTLAPSPAPATLAPSPAPTTLAPSPAPAALAPSPAPTAVAPSSAPTTVAPSPALTAVAPYGTWAPTPTWTLTAAPTSSLLVGTTRSPAPARSTTKTPAPTTSIGDSDSHLPSWSSNTFIVTVVSIIVGVVVAAVVAYFRRNADELRWVRSAARIWWRRGGQGQTVIGETETEHNPDARSPDPGSNNNVGRSLQPWSLGEVAGVALQEEGRASVDDIRPSAAADHPPTFFESSKSCIPSNRGTNIGERPGGCDGSVATEDNENHKSETSPLVKAPRFGVAQAVFDAAQELAQRSTVPGISEAASLVLLLVDLVRDPEGNPSAAEGKLRWCRSIVALLNRASGVLDKVDGASIGAERVLLDDVHESIDDLVQLIQTYKSRNALAKIVMSSLFKRRQDEAEAVIDSAISRLQVGLQLQHGRKLDAVGKNVEAGLQLQERESRELAASSVAEALVESRRKRRRRKLDQLEIPEDHLTITNELLGKGGFASVYMADYNGRNAGVKVVEVEHDLHGPAGDPVDGILGDRSKRERREDRRRAFMRELEAMTRLRSPFTVHLYGAATSRSDQLILVMELMSGGDLLRLLKVTEHPLAEDKVRRIVGDVCAGMTFLHEKATIHGDLKSANVLFDGFGRAKIGDFGTSRWAQHTSTTGLVTYTTKRNQSGHMSLPWAAPEVMDGNEISFKSDVYSFAIVIWEVLTRELPWAGELRAQQIFVRVVFKGERPRIPGDAPDDLVDAMRACWSSAPEDRPSFASIMKGMKLHGWKER